MTARVCADVAVYLQSLQGVRRSSILGLLGRGMPSSVCIGVGILGNQGQVY